MASKLKVDKLSYKYNGLSKVLKGVSFAIEQGEFIALIGPNGSGKSTLLKNINSILKPEQGKVYLDELDLQKFAKKEMAKRVAVVPQNTTINFDFTVEEIVLMGRAPYISRFKSESSEDYQIANEVMELTNTAQFADRRIDQLSGGERQRVILARALAQQPEVMLLDEPTSNLDINYQLEMMELLRKLNREQGLTILIVSHDLNLASQYCDKLLLLNEGKVYSFGTPQEIITVENIEDVYGSKVIIRRNYPSNRPYVTLVDNRYLSSEKRDYKVHLICGGGSGRDLIENLVELGYQVSCGVVNKKDSDWEVAKLCDIEVISEAPFGPITEEQHQANLAKIKMVDTVVLTDIPFGPGNLLNLEAALWAAKEGKEVIVIDQVGIEKKDYTAGKGSSLFRSLMEENIIMVKEKYEILEKLN
ncbi:heme ABC transporter ATP-binding protein [Natroniella sp. ANB-PHB2]|uniref:heme ABC transporter ATP-binding protein n=1 Tax=Natroniella sp. ANB-PHB2 TaxID=3384444 RepID=UPI0038D36870